LGQTWLGSRLTTTGHGITLLPKNGYIRRQAPSGNPFQLLTTGHMPVFSAQGLSSTCPPHLTRATVFQRGNTLVCSGYSPIKLSRQIIYSSFADYIQGLQHDKWCFDFIEFEQNGRNIAEAIKDHQAKAVGDGSFKHPYGMAATIIEGTSSTVRMSTRVITPGGENDLSSFRSELAGIYTTLTIINHLCLYHGIQDGHIEFACDGLSTLQVVFSETEISPEDSDGDLVMASRKAWSESHIQWTTRHVSGHQDEAPNHTLDVWETLNIEPDERAKRFLPFGAT
jgi:hypothetical protein